LKNLIIGLLPLIGMGLVAFLFIRVGYRAKPHKHLTDPTFGTVGQGRGTRGDPIREVEEAMNRFE